MQVKHSAVKEPLADSEIQLLFGIKAPSRAGIAKRKRPD